MKTSILQLKLLLHCASANKGFKKYVHAIHVTISVRYCLLHKFTKFKDYRVYPNA